jgi:hypothetical protein
MSFFPQFEPLQMHLWGFSENPSSEPIFFKNIEMGNILTPPSLFGREEPNHLNGVAGHSKVGSEAVQSQKSVTWFAGL